MTAYSTIVTQSWSVLPIIIHNIRMSVTLKIVPVPTGTTRDDIAAKIQGDQIDDVEIDETDHIAYVRLRDGGFLEALAAKYGEDLKIADWAARIEILEDDFNW